MNARQLYQLTYEEFDRNGQPLIQVNYDYEGVIGDIFVYSEFVDRMLKVDLEDFESCAPTRYANLQQRILDALGHGDFRGQ